MATASVDKSELEYLKFCRDKLRDIAVIINEEEAPTLRPEASEVGVPTAKHVGKKNEEKKSAEDKLKEIKKIIKS